MTKIFAANTEAKESEEKEAKKLGAVTVSSTLPQPAFYPITLPISSIVSKKKKCRASHIIIALLLLWTLMTLAIVFRIVPNSFYRSVHNFVSSDNGIESAARMPPAISDYAETNARVAGKFDIFNMPEKEVEKNLEQETEVMVDNRQRNVIENQIPEVEVNKNNDGDMKQFDTSIPNRFEAMKAIEMLLRIPGVQQVAIVQNNGRLPENPIPKSDFPADENLRNTEETIPPQMRPFESAQQAEEREVAAEREMPRFLMGPQIREAQEPQMMLPFQQIRILQQPMLPFNRAIPSMMTTMMQNQRNVHSLPLHLVAPRIPPMHPFLFPQLPKLQQQQMPQEMIRIPIIPPQMFNKAPQDNMESGPPGIIPPSLRDNTINVPEVERKVPLVKEQTPIVLDGTSTNRDMIFKELRSRAQMQQQQQQQQQNLLQPVQPSIMIRPAISDTIPPAQKNADEIFRELQQQTLKMQIEQDQLEAEVRQEKVKNDAPSPMIMIADTFPRQVIVNEVEDIEAETTSLPEDETTVTATQSTTNSSEPFGAFLKLFDLKESTKEDDSSEEHQDITAIHEDIKPTVEKSSEEDKLNSQSASEKEMEMGDKTDNNAAEASFIQDSLSTSIPAMSEDNLELDQPEPPSPSGIFPDTKSDDNHDGDTALDSSISLNEAPKRQQ
ncbi:unnamed protein product [Thelazia callipaeda]|uniref:DUF3736 domain-containing protein n=1 Tax=Thelazia callipaeda TaxID=103827 RepID=A0A0N5CNX3_THECL|nr:unnamed protein product [Thelazia callipaeda]